MTSNFFTEFRQYKDPLLSEYLEIVFEGAVRYYHKQVDHVCSFLTAERKIPKDCAGICAYQGIFRRDVDLMLGYTGKYYRMKDAQGLAELEKLTELRNKIMRDCTFLQHWLRSLINIPKPTLQDLRNIFPDELASSCKKLNVLSRTKEFFIPEGKINQYKKASELLMYYLGMRLLV